MPERYTATSLPALLLAGVLLVLAGPLAAASQEAGDTLAAGAAPPPCLPIGDNSEAPAPCEPLDTGPPELERGRASWYGPGFHGRRTANGERFNIRALTAAHKTLPFGTLVRVRSLRTGQEVDVRINDRGPFRSGVVIDLSRAAAQVLGLTGLGTKDVVLTVIDASQMRPDPTEADAAAAPKRRR